MRRRDAAYMPGPGQVAWDQILIRDLHPEDHEYEVVWNGATGALLAGQVSQHQSQGPPHGQITMDVVAVSGRHYRRPVADVIAMLEKSFRKHGSQTLVQVCRRTGLKGAAVNHALRKGRGRIGKVATVKKVAIYGLVSQAAHAGARTAPGMEGANA